MAYQYIANGIADITLSLSRQERFIQPIIGGKYAENTRGYYEVSAIQGNQVFCEYKVKR